MLLAVALALPTSGQQAGEPATAAPPTAAAPAAAPATATAPSPLFRDVTEEAGITFSHHSAPEKKYILESMSGGVALLDYDGDGRLDVYFVDSLTVDTANDPRAARSALYRNLGGMRFADVTDAAGVGHPGWGMGVCVADYDGDGRPDLYVTALGANRLYRNRGDGSFEEVARRAGVEGGGWSTGCGFADYDRDGDLDLFVSRYVEVDLGKLPEFGKDKTCQYRGVAVQCGPRGLPGTGDLLYRNDGDGSFTEVGEAAGVADPDGLLGLGVAWLDVDGDGWPDLFVANDSNANQLYLNRRDGTFEEVAFPIGVAVSEDGGEQGSMGIAVGDYDGSGRQSLFVTNFAEEYNALYRNDGDYFTDASFRSKSAPPSLPYVGWGTAFFDFDNDGWLDLIVANGHVYPQLDNAKLGASAPYRQRRLLYRNLGGGVFEEIAERHGEALTEPRVGRGLAVGDLDDDGRLDVVINDLDGAPQVLRNELAGGGHWLLVELVGRAPNTSAIGATVELTAGGRTQVRTVRSGTSYLSQDDLRQHFGLGAAGKAERVRVVWPDGSATEIADVAADRKLVIEEPADEPAEEPPEPIPAPPEAPPGAADTGGAR
jgi:enediyne biosynthesis protein E4